MSALCHSETQRFISESRCTSRESGDNLKREMPWDKAQNTHSRENAGHLESERHCGFSGSFFKGNLVRGGGHSQDPSADLFSMIWSGR